MAEKKQSTYKVLKAFKKPMELKFIPGDGPFYYGGPGGIRVKSNDFLGEEITKFVVKARVINEEGEEVPFYGLNKKMVDEDALAEYE